MSSVNLFNLEPIQVGVEHFETLLECRNVSIERIQSPPGTRSEVFIQEQDEWVCILQGEAWVEMHDEVLSLSRGETLFIPSGTPHQVVNTSSDPLCIWLAVHIQ